MHFSSPPMHPQSVQIPPDTLGWALEDVLKMKARASAAAATMSRRTSREPGVRMGLISDLLSDVVALKSVRDPHGVDGVKSIVTRAGNNSSDNEQFSAMAREMTCKDVQGRYVQVRWSGRPLPTASRCAKMVLKRLSQPSEGEGIHMEEVSIIDPRPYLHPSSFNTSCGLRRGNPCADPVGSVNSAYRNQACLSRGAGQQVQNAQLNAISRRMSSEGPWRSAQAVVRHRWRPENEACRPHNGRLGVSAYSRVFRCFWRHTANSGSGVSLRAHAAERPNPTDP